MVYLKMVTGTPYEVRMFYQKLKKWSSVWLIKYVWFNIFWLFGPKYVLIPTYGLFETEEYYKYRLIILAGFDVFTMGEGRHKDHKCWGGAG